MPGARLSDADLRAAFTRGLVGVVAVFIAVAGLIAIANHGRQRAEGRAENWLNAVSDTTRKGVRGEATKRAEEIGPLVLAYSILPPASQTDGKSAFTDLEVGKAVPVAGTARVRVPFQLHQRLSGSSPVDETKGAVVLQKDGDDWKVVGLDHRQDVDGKVPSEGGSPPSKAPAPLFLGALVVGLGVTAAATALVRAAGR